MNTFMDCEICKSPTVIKGVLILDLVPVDLCSPCIRKVRIKIPQSNMVRIYKTAAQIAQYQDNEICIWREAAVLDLFEVVGKIIEEFKRRKRVEHL